MATISQVTEAVFRGRYEDQVTAGANAAAAALKQNTAAVRENEEAVTRATRSGRSWVNSQDQIAVAAQKAAKAQRDLSAAQTAINTDLATGKVTAEEAARALAALEAKASAARERLAALQQSTASSASVFDTYVAKVNAAASAMQRMAAPLGGQSFTPDAGLRARAAEIAAYGAELDRLRAKFNPMFAAGQQYRQTFEEIRQAQKVGAISAKEAADAIERAQVATKAQIASLRGASAGMQQFSGSARNMSQAITQLVPQLNDLAVQMASGQGLFMPLIQQGPQITQIFGGIRQTIAAAMAAITPYGLAAIAATAATLGMAAAIESQARALNTLENRLRSTRGDYEQLAVAARNAARDFAYSSQFSVADSRAAAATIGGARNFSGTEGDLRRLLTLAGDLATVLNKDLAGGAEVVAKAFADPLAQATELAAAGFRTVDQTTVGAIRRLQETGDKAGATTLLLNRLNLAAAGAANNRTEIESGWTALGNAIGRIGDMAIRATEPLAGLVARGIMLSDTARSLMSLDYVLNGGGAGAGGFGAPGTPAAAPNTAYQDALGVAQGLGGRAADLARVRRQREQLLAQRRNAQTPEDRLAFSSGLQSLAQQAQGLRGPEAQQLDSLRDARRVAEAPAGAAREVLQAQLALNRALEQGGQGTANTTQLERVRQEVLGRLAGELENLVNDQDREAQGNRVIAEAYRESTAAGQAAEIRIRAQADALKYAEANSEEYGVVLDILTERYTRNARAAAERNSAQKAEGDQQRQLELLRREIELVGESTTTRERELAVMRERQRIAQEPGGNLLSEETVNRRLQNARDIADATQALARQRDAYSELQNIGTQAFDRIGSAITEAFTTGNTKAINFLSIGKAVISELLQGFLKLAVVNPLKNAVFGRNAGTLSDLASAANGTGGGLLGSALRFFGFGGDVGAAKSGSTAAMTGAQAETILNGGSVAGFSSGGGFSLGGIGNILSGGRSIWNAFSGNGMSNTGIGFVDRALNYQLFGSGYGGALPAGFAEGTAAAYGPGLSGVGGLDAPYSSALSVGGDGVGATLGGALGAAGSIFSGITGFMRGGTGGIIQGVGGVVGGGMQIASMMGLGSMLGPWGMAIAAIASILGSLFGGKKAFSGGAITVGPAASNGLLSILGVASKNYNASEDVKKMQEDLDKFNKELTDRSIKINVDTIGTVTQDRFLTTAGVPMFKQGLGQGASGASTWEDVYKAIAANLKSDVNPGTNFVLNVGRQRGYDLETQLLNVDWNQKVYEPMVVKTREVTDEFSKALKELNDSMLPVIDKARDLGLATDELTTYLAKATRDITEQRDAQTFGLTGGLEVRRLRALGDAQGADLLAYDVQAQQEAYSFRKSLEQVGLEAGALAEQMQKLRDVQAIERDVIVANAAANAGAAASGKINTGIISSLTDYAHSLRTSDMSPGTPFDRLSEAERRFNAVAGAAAAGDAASMSAFQGYANEYLTASRSVYGSGTGFASAFSRVTDYIDRIGQQQANELTAAVFNAGNAALSAAVVAAIERLQDEVAALRRETKQVSTAPDRSAA